MAATIDIYLVADRIVSDNRLLKRYMSWMSQSELQQWRRFHFAEHRNQYLLTRALVRWTLSQHSPAVAEHQWEFKFNEHGRPSIAPFDSSSTNLNFNVSHTKGMIALVIGQMTELGVDVENTKRDPEIAKSAKSFFSPLEITALRQLPKQRQLDRFFDLWTLKESYIKARGLGLAIPLDSFSFDLSSTNIHLTLHQGANDDPDGWYFWRMEPSDQHKLAIAWRAHAPTTDPVVRVFDATVGISVSRRT